MRRRRSSTITSREWDRLTELLCPTSTYCFRRKIPYKVYSTYHVVWAEGRVTKDVINSAPSYHTFSSLFTYYIYHSSIMSDQKPSQSASYASKVLADEQSYTSSSLLVGLMSPSSPFPRLESRKVTSSLSLSSLQRSAPPLLPGESKADMKGENFNPDFLKINPNGTVPTLVSGGQTFTDSTVRTSSFLPFFHSPNPRPL